MASTKAIIAAIDKVEILDIHTATEQHAGTKINSYFRATGRDEVTTVFAKASGRFGAIGFSVTKTETVKYRHDAEGDIVGEEVVSTTFTVSSESGLTVQQAIVLVSQTSFKF